MPKVFLLFFFTLFSTLSVLSQKPVLLIKSSEKGFYLEHKVVPKESFYSVGRLYNISPKLIATYNKLDLNKGLLIDQKIRIPLTDTNFTRNGNSGTPVYYKVGDQEGLMKVSSKNGDLSLAKIRSWNNLSGDVVKEGARLIVGFLVTKGMPSVTINHEVIKEKPAETVSVPEVNEKIPVEQPVKKAVLDSDPVKEAVVTITEPVKPVIIQPKTEEAVNIKEVSNTVAAEQGYFRSFFDRQVINSPVTKNETVTAGIFKTTSGWQDGKYYLLIDGVASGSIIKLTNPANNRVVFAKVLGEMSGIRQNEGLTVRISNAAASALQVTEQDKFIIKINY